MNNEDHEIESMLKNAPRPKAPTNLRGKLHDNVPGRSNASRVPREGSGWLRLWWPALVSGCLALAGLGGVAVQQSKINALREEVETLREEIRVQEQEATSRDARRLASADTDDGLTGGRTELDRLRATTQSLQSEVERLDALREETRQMETELAAVARQAMSEEFTAMEVARAKALRIQCVNNMKQLGLAARIWATDNQDVLPPDILSMRNELVAPRVLVCPADESRTPAASWEEFHPGAVSYAFLAANGSEIEVQRVMFRCPIHDNVTLCDGSVQQASTENGENRLRWDGGKLWFDSPAPTNPYGGAPAGAAAQMDEEMMRRYGLISVDTEVMNPDGQTQVIQVQETDTVLMLDAEGNPVESPKMDLLMMMRYGLLPEGTEIDELDPRMIPDPYGTPQEGIEEERR